MEKHTAKHFVLQLGSLASLYLSLSFFIVLLFGLINLSFPDGLDSYWQMESSASMVRLGFAMVLVFFPTYLVLTRFVNQNRKKSNDASYLTLTKWLIYLSLLVGGAVLLGDLVVVIMGFLEGELTSRFILKAFAVFLVIGFAFDYYFLDAKGYWITHQKQSLWCAAIATTLIVAALITSLFFIQTPSEVREMKVDQQMVNDLQDIQWRIEDFFRTNQMLPENLQSVYGSFAVPTAPEDGGEYVYEVTSEETYSLCTTFNQNMPGSEIRTSAAMDRVQLAPTRMSNYNWDYQAGYWCFDRVAPSEEVI